MEIQNGKRDIKNNLEGRQVDRREGIEVSERDWGKRGNIEREEKKGARLGILESRRLQMWGGAMLAH